MELLYKYTAKQIINSEYLNDKLTEKRDINKPSINIFILFVFILLIAFYATINLLFMTVTILLFLYWIAQVEFLSVKKMYDNPIYRKDLYFVRAQKLLQRSKYSSVISLYQNYLMKHESLENMELYIVSLFMVKDFEQVLFVSKDIDISDELKSMIKYSLYRLNKKNELEKNINYNSLLDKCYLYSINKDESLLHEVLDSNNRELIDIIQSM